MTSKYGPRAERVKKTLTKGTKSVHSSIAINFTFDVTLNYKLSCYKLCGGLSYLLKLSLLILSIYNNLHSFDCYFTNTICCQSIFTMYIIQ